MAPLALPQPGEYFVQNACSASAIYGAGGCKALRAPLAAAIAEGSSSFDAETLVALRRPRRRYPSSFEIGEKKLQYEDPDWEAKAKKIREQRGEPDVDDLGDDPKTAAAKKAQAATDKKILKATAKAAGEDPRKFDDEEVDAEDQIVEGKDEWGGPAMQERTDISSGWFIYSIGRLPLLAAALASEAPPCRRSLRRSSSSSSSSRHLRRGQRRCGARRHGDVPYVSSDYAAFL
eukprot:TRINITY_DN5166_c0_g1_i2.p1 TRINITY_DN5166_c0_g1~~TRINITY_DN5166_c0_g1_i2.p1  ORF type:complete len:233 (-),score=61.15 TRINITY_DN5166_c0_g1_i2:103-801(-)